MYKPLLIASTLFGVAGLPVVLAESNPPPVQFAPPQPVVNPTGPGIPPVPSWVSERRAQLGIRETTIDGTSARKFEPPAAPQPPQPPTYETSGVPLPGDFAPPEQTVDQTALPAWVVEQYATMSAPPAPEARPAPPARPQPPAQPQPMERPAVPDWVGNASAGTRDFTPPSPPERPAMPGMTDGQAAAMTRPQRPQAPQPPQRPPVAAQPESSAPAAPARAEPPARPAIPEWISTRHAAIAERPTAPPRPAAPTMTGEAAPAIDAPAMRPFPPVYRPVPAYGPWGGAPYGGGWGPGPYRGWNNGWTPWGNGWGNGWGNNGWGNSWMPWGNGWGNNGWGNSWMPWDSGWGNNGWGNSWMPWDSGWGGNGWNNNYGSGWGDGWGNTTGDATGDAAGDVDFSFAMSGRASADLTGRGYGSGYGDGYGRGYGYQYGGPVYPMPPMPPQPMPQAPAEAEPEGPADGDGDGVADTTDLCPETAPDTAVDALGCAETARIVLRGVNFKTDSDELTADSLAILDGVSATLSANPQIKVMVAGHTDSDGEEAYNKDLSQRRAQAVVSYLAEHGVDRNNMIAKGFGEEQPIAGNDTADGKAQNRRVELNRL
ncbi:MAG: OmpA family protein [Gammaproteobacteria bacterium]|nr:OmpA family protein [Gammaproteobacteria bacterium]